MARPKKRGLDYFPFDVGFFDDRKIKELKGKFGSDGITVYIYLLCLIYKENGYYIQLDDGFNYVASADLLMDSGKIGQIINFLCKRSLFDDILFTSDKVLTSRGIQLRFQEVVKSRKKEIDVSKFWILSEDETQGCIKCTDFQSYSEKNGGFSGNNPSFSEKNAIKESKVKESKVKESKVKENRGSESSRAVSDKKIRYSELVTLKEKEYEELVRKYGKADVGRMIEILDSYKRSKGKRYASDYGAINKWVVTALGEEKRRGGQEMSMYDDSGLDYDELERVMREKL